MTDEFKNTPGDVAGNVKSKTVMNDDFLFTCPCKAGIHLLAEVSSPLGGNELNTHFRFDRDGSFSQVEDLIYICSTCL